MFLTLLFSVTFADVDMNTAMFRWDMITKIAQKYDKNVEVVLSPLRKVEVNKVQLAFSEPCVIINDRAYFQLKPILLALNINSTYASKIIEINISSRKIQLEIGSKYVSVIDGGLVTSMELDFPLLCIDGKILIPIKTLGELIKANVTYNKETVTFLISTK